MLCTEINSFSYFIVFVEAVVRILGCACDANGSMSLSLDEVVDGQCGDFQNWAFGETVIDESHFALADQNGDGEIDAMEGAAAVQYVIENHFNSCSDNWPQKKCNRMMNKGKCTKPKVMKNCKQTCGFCM